MKSSRRQFIKAVGVAAMAVPVLGSVQAEPNFNEADYACVTEVITPRKYRCLSKSLQAESRKQGPLDKLTPDELMAWILQENHIERRRAWGLLQKGQECCCSTCREMKASASPALLEAIELIK